MSKNGTTRASQTGGTGGRPTTWMIIGAAVVLIASVAVGLRMRGAGPTASAPTSAGPGQAYSVPPGNATGVPLPPYVGGARLAADVTRLDFGQKQYLEPVDAQFTVRNVGDAPLLIADVTAKAVAGC